MGEGLQAILIFYGVTPENNYTPTQPYQITIFDGPYSYQQPGYAKLMIRSSGAESPREIKLSKSLSSAGQWFLWENYLISDIQAPTSIGSGS
ncbi:MAG: DUF6935 domain-containing protein [Christensenellales bacterium]